MEKEKSKSMEAFLSLWDEYEDVDIEVAVEDGQLTIEEEEEAQKKVTDYFNELVTTNVSIEKIPLELEYQYDVATGRGLRLKSVEAFDKKNKKIYDGLQSDFFGTDFSSDWAFKERFSCLCGKYMGKRYHNMICDSCGHKIEFNDIDLSKFGWIVIDKFRVMSPIYYAKLAEALGKADGEYILKLIISRDYSDENSNDIEYNDRMFALSKKHPFVQKGMLWLNEHLEEVLDYYEKRKPNKKKLFQELRAEQHMIWTKAIPVYTALLRTELPGEKGSKSYKLKINTCYKAIIRLAKIINDYEDDELNYRILNSIDIFLFGIQKEIEKIFELTYLDLTDKTGILVSKVLGGRYNFSGRSIIVPDSGSLRADEVLIGYVTALELFRYEIQNEYRKIYNCSPSKANMIWKKATNHFDRKIYAIIKHLIAESEGTNNLGVLINRNPSINYGSFMWVKVVGVKEDITDKTLTISTHIIVPKNADFDGDLENVFRIIGEDFQRRFSKNLNPRYNLFVSRMDNKINPETLPVKDEIVAFWAFNNM